MPEGGERRLHHLEEPHAHEPRRPEADMASLRELPERHPCKRALRICRPLPGRELGHRDHRSRPGREGPAARAALCLVKPRFRF